MSKIAEEYKAKQAAKRDPKLHQAEAPAGYLLKGVSTLLDADGNVKQTWVKTTKEGQNLEALLDAFKAAVEAAEIPKAKKVAAPKMTASHLLTVYPWGDPHIGMLAWQPETRNTFDLKIATAHLYEAVDKLVDIAPASEEALIINLGDYFHSDNQQNRTSRSGHALDVDSRWAKILVAGVGVAVRCVQRALEKHKRVTVDTRIGNHDDHSSVMLAASLAQRFMDNPRVTINLAENMFFYKEFGSCLIGSTHGHTVKPDKLPGVMATDEAAAWGRTKHRYWYTGHVHHESKKEYPGCVVETFRTLAGRDAWHHGQGYRAGRSMVCDVLHKDHGRVVRHEIGVGQLSE